MMSALAIDTVSAKPSISVRKGDVFFSHGLSAGRKQSKTLLDELENLFDQAEISFQDLEALAVLTGPGSFTGIRVGLSFLKGISIALDIPLKGANHFDLIAASILPESGEGIIILESGRDEKFCQYTKDGALVDQPFNVAFSDLDIQDYIISDFDVSGFSGVQTIDYAHHTAELLLRHIDLAKDDLSPFYIRDADTSSPKKNIL